ncbi:MAG TPA: M20/M25/M40 family metallo-hydrolase [Spirochaetia bacterium]|nr:M20/M25/M40 family metallo-hydrolase [Spirochaetia bacterium]
MDTAVLLRELVEARGPSGYEAEVREVVRKRFGDTAHEVRVDSLGNLIALRRGEVGGDGAPPASHPAVMLAGHMDEIALMVTRIEKGFLQVTQVGGFDPRVLFGQEVVVHGTRPLPGLVVSVPPHFTDAAEREQPVALEKLFIDVGLPPREVETLVHVGDLITLAGRFVALNGGYAAGKSMDDRAALAAIAMALDELSRRRHSWDVYAVATVQEESSMAGAVTGAYGIDPAIAVVVDVTFAMQAGLSPGETVKMDGGPSIAVGPNFHPVLHRRLAAAASALEIPHQTEVMAGASGTDAWAIQVSRSGVPCGLLGIPARSMHTPVETVCLRDIERTAKLIAEFVSRLEPGFQDSLITRDALARREG